MLCKHSFAEDHMKKEGYNDAHNHYLQQQQQQQQQLQQAQNISMQLIINLQQAYGMSIQQVLPLVQQAIQAQTTVIQLMQHIVTQATYGGGDQPWLPDFMGELAAEQMILGNIQQQEAQIQQQLHQEQVQQARQQAIVHFQHICIHGSPQAQEATLEDILGYGVPFIQELMQYTHQQVQQVFGTFQQAIQLGDMNVQSIAMQDFADQIQILGGIEHLVQQALVAGLGPWGVLQEILTTAENLQFFLQQLQPQEPAPAPPAGTITFPPSPPPSPPDGGGVAMLMGYNPAGNLSSLQGLQCLLVGPIFQVSNILRIFTLKANAGSLGNVFPKGRFSSAVISGSPHGFEKSHKGSSGFKVRLTPQRSIATWTSFPSTVVTHQQSMGYLEEPLGGLFARPCHVFSSVERYQQDLECKVNAAQVGFIVSPTVLFKTGLAFTYTKEESQTLYGAKIGKAVGAAQAISETKSLSALVAWNTDKVGVTGCITSCYSWGHMKNTRYFSHAQGEAQAKGNPDITLFGGLAQLGYNLEFSKNLLVTPYVEYMFVSAMWSPYEEIAGPLPSKISQNKEQVVEKSIGLRNCWSITESSQLQTWIAGVSGQHTTAGLHARPIIAPLSMYELSIPGHRRTYLQGEAGLSYNLHLTTDLDIGLYGSVCMEHMKYLTHQNITCIFRYKY